MTHGSLFSGIGGFDLAAEWMGWENVFHCEWNEFGQKVLKYHFPKSISYHDITKTDFTIHRGRIDILTGGFPCQPYSMAGKRKGKDDERHLWPEMLRAIREIRPRWVVGENVFGLVNWSGGLVFHEVQTDLEAEGYEVFPYVLPASAVNAPHRRDRVWFVAYTSIERCERGEKVNRWNEQAEYLGIERPCSLSNAPNTNGNGQHQCNCNDEKQSSKRGFDALDDFEQVFYNADTTSERLEGLRRQKGRCSELHTGHLTKGGWETFPTQSPICGGDDGLPTELDGITFSKWRNESIKAYGNAIVPQVVYQIFKSIEQYEKDFITS